MEGKPHDSDSIQQTVDVSSRNYKEVTRKHLINRLNFVNFQDGIIHAFFRHEKYNNIINIPAKPLPCLGEHLDCLWQPPPDSLPNLQPYRFEKLLIDDGRKIFLVKSDLVTVTSRGMFLHLPETCTMLSLRRMKRYSCSGVDVSLIQNSAVFSGELVDFCAASFRVKLIAEPPQTFRWVDSDSPVNIILSTIQGTLYSGECNIVRTFEDRSGAAFVLAPLKSGIRRFRPKENRSIRLTLIPSPNIDFVHPFTGKTTELKVVDISGSGFSVEEDEETSILLPGMIIPTLEINFAGGFVISCKAQVVYQKKSDGRTDGKLKCGMAILDITRANHVKLLAYLDQANDRNSYLNKKVDLDSLWNLFFETGFIYPEKYAMLQENKEKFKVLYKKLYLDSPDITRFFIYQESGTILGHMSMIRFQKNSWMIHHHAAVPESRKAGIMVLNQIGRSVADSYEFHSAGMRYVLCFYQPTKKFPEHVFGGTFRGINDRTRCSVDPFGYFHWHVDQGKGGSLFPFEMIESNDHDLEQLVSFYNQGSGGLMTTALDLESSSAEQDEVSMEYRQIGLTKERRIISLKIDNILRAVFIINKSDFGINMSDITNSVKIIVLDKSVFSRDNFRNYMNSIIDSDSDAAFPVLVYPREVSDLLGIDNKKIYNLWILDMSYYDDYVLYLKKLLRFIK